MTGSWKGRGNQYIEFVRVLYCKLPTNGKQLPAFPLEPVLGSNPGLRGGRRECIRSHTPFHIQLFIHSIKGGAFVYRIPDERIRGPSDCEHKWCSKHNTFCVTVIL